MEAIGISHIGKIRKRNEDFFLIDQNRKLFMVCDGMGGHRGGNVASRMAVEVVNQSLHFNDITEIPEALRQAIQRANQEIRKTGQQNEEVREMGTTITAAVIDQGKIYFGHVGDSSLFIIRKDEIRKLTHDHTLAEKMFKEGLLKKEEMRDNAFNHVLTRALGSESQVHIDIDEDTVQAGDWVLLCTDGLSNLVEMWEIPALLEKQHEPQQAAQELIDLALSRGGHDNITVVLLRL